MVVASVELVDVVEDGMSDGKRQPSNEKGGVVSDSSKFRFRQVKTEGP